MSRLTVENYNELVGLVFRAGADPSLWPVFIEQLDRVLDCANLSLYGVDAHSDLALGEIVSRNSAEFMGFIRSTTHGGTHLYRYF